MTVSGPAQSADNWIEVGRIRGGFGVQGALKIESYAGADASVLLRVRSWRLVDRRVDTGPRAAVLPFGLPAEVQVASAKAQGDAIIASLTVALTREQALALKGVEIQVERGNFPPPAADEYYWSDLIGCRVQGQGESDLGVVVAVDDHGAQQQLRLDTGMLIPLVPQIVVEVQVAQRRIVADWSPDWT